METSGWTPKNLSSLCPYGFRLLWSPMSIQAKAEAAPELSQRRGFLPW